jgi:hypothetical protein
MLFATATMYHELKPSLDAAAGHIKIAAGVHSWLVEDAASPPSSARVPLQLQDGALSVVASAANISTVPSLEAAATI